MTQSYFTKSEGANQAQLGYPQPIQEKVDTLAAALAYAERGWFVFPCKPDKKPLTLHGKDDATTEPEQIRAWWERWPAANIGVACGESGLVAIDLDIKNGVDGLAAWEGLGINDAGALHQRTPSGGLHLVFCDTTGGQIRNSTSKLAAGVDVRGNGGYILLAPSRTPAGAYQAIGEWNREPGPLPAALAMLLQKPEQAPAAPAQPINRNGNGHHTQDDAGEYWLEKAKERAAPGNRNDTGFWLAGQLRDAGISRGEAERLMLDYAHSQAEDYTEREALASLESAYRTPAREPARRIGFSGNGYHAGEPQPPDNWDPDQEPDDLPTEIDPEPAAPMAERQASKKGGGKKAPPPTDPDLAARWLAGHPDTAWGLGEFRRYAAGLWPVLPLDIVKREIKGILDAAQAEGYRPTSARLSSVLELARVEIAIDSAEWDADPDIVVCKNGVLHIPTRQLLPHSPDNKVTTGLNFDYDPCAFADTFEYFLNRSAPDAKDFLQEFAGLSLTTDTSFEIALWLYGPPGGGKSTLLAAWEAMLGARAGLLGLADIERSRFSLTDLPGKTLMVSAEQPTTYLAATHILNQIISGERVTVDQKFRDPLTITPRAKLAFAMNELPRVNSAGSGLFRRVKVVNFPAIPEDERDPEIKERIKTEGAGILNWALEGLVRLRERGRFDVPACVQDATAHFRETNDVPAVFVSECCLTGPEYRTQSMVLYTAYKNWCDNNGHKAQSSTAVADDWRRLGFDKKPINGRNYWQGVGLLEEK